MDDSDDLRLETPEQIEVELELVGAGSRFLAVVVDWFWKALFTAALLLLSSCVLGGFGRVDAFENPSMVLIAVVVAVLYALWLGYAIYFEVKWNGQTPGKRVVGIRVIQETGAPVDFRAACVRNLLAMADFLPMMFLLGALLVQLTPRRQRLGDMAAGTVVIREREVKLGEDPTDALTEHAADEYAFTAAQLANLTPGDRAVIREFLRRYRGMPPRNADRLALTLAEKYLNRTGYPLPEPFAGGWEAYRFLASLLRDLESARKHG
jgi:uncharacterized RDD family membrane protein YckC